MKTLGRYYGHLAEKEFERELEEAGIRYERIDTYYDYQVGPIKCEVKSCHLSNNDGQERACRIGRFDFNSEENRSKQQKAGCLVIFIIGWKGRFLFIGSCETQFINQDKRYIPLSQINDYPIRDWADTLELLRVKQHGKTTTRN